MPIKLELLAPAKDKAIGIAAINCGADAVYIAGPSFGARESAGNSFSDIEELTGYAHKFGAKVYIVINTIIYDSELEKVEQYLNLAYQSGCDAVIVQDMGITKLKLPPIPLFASTQCNIRTKEQAMFLESAGFQRLILARELSLEQIREIREATNCDLESFVHGALCVSYSGECYMSQHLANRSANRGCCIQACRSKYDLIDDANNVLVKDKALLSLKDLSLANHIGELVNCGISSFKIEGRLKNISYVKNIVRYYRDVIDSFISNNSKYEKSSFGILRGGFSPNPDYTFNRGYTDLYITGKRSQWSSMESAKGIGEEIGLVTEVVNGEKGNFGFRYSHNNGEQQRIKNGDGLCFISQSGGVIGIRADIVEDSFVKTKWLPELKKGVKLYRNYNITFEKELEKNTPIRVILVNLSIYINKLTPNTFRIDINGVCENGKTYTSSTETVAQKANNIELAEKNIRTQIEKSTSHYLFKVEKIEYDSIPFLPLSFLNNLRREIAQKIDSERPPVQKMIVTHNIIPPKDNIPLNCSNHLSSLFYKELGIEPDTAFELEHKKDFELMRTKYCIRYELGMCLKDNGSKRDTRKLFLLNNGRKFRLIFDCVKCEMVVKQS